MAITVGSTTPNTGLITSLGVGSGIDVNSLVTQLVTAKKTPQQNQITADTTTANTQLSALGQVSAALSALQSAMAPLTDGSALSARAVSTGNANVLGASSTGTPVNGSYQIEVTQLATSLKASSGAFTNSSAAVGTGTLTIAVGGQSMQLDLDSTNNSLAAIRDAINNSGSNPGVSATIVNATDGAHLVLTGTRTGEANGFTISSSGGDGGLAALNYDAGASSGNALNVITAAQDAQYSIDGMAGHSASNTVTDAIDGLSLSLAGTGTSALNVTSDTATSTSALTNLVNTYNSFVGIYQGLTRYDPTGGSAGALIGDATLNGISNKLANIVGGAANGGSLAALGISLQVDGTLALDKDKLAAGLADGGKQAAALFGGAGGYAAQLNTQLSQWVGSTGVLASRSDSLTQQLKALGDQQSALNARMDSLTAMYTAQFNALDTLMSKLNSTSSYLQQQFDAMGNVNSSKNK
ncbi:MAG TPA: flagellar filament capping protein FliD [Rhodanobacter sp.]|jgi:flagellar hook-associated protein 2|nr:flagellar filament capping protein FliD [Rhodanobacter sp.]